jgi:[acyl-carrier-protein] S-malonyltransferase
MAKSLYEQYIVARQAFEEASDTLGLSLEKLCFEGSMGELSRTENAQVAILTSSFASYQVYMEEIGIKPVFGAGHSLGEYSALTCSGAISLKDELNIVYKRGKIAQKIIEEGTCAMTIIDDVDANALEEYCKRVSEERNYVSISCYNSPNQIAISGHMDAVQQVEDFAFDLEAKVTPLFGSAPFHCIQMKSLAEELRKIMLGYEFFNFEWPVISNATALPYNNPYEIVTNLEMHMIKPVQWQKIIGYLEKSEVNITIEMGSKSVLSRLVELNSDKITPYCFDQKNTRQKITDYFSKANKKSRVVPTVVTLCLAAAVATPNLNTNANEFKEIAQKAYKKIEEISLYSNCYYF